MGSEWRLSCSTVWPSRFKDRYRSRDETFVLWEPHARLRCAAMYVLLYWIPLAGIAQKVITLQYEARATTDPHHSTFSIINHTTPTRQPLQQQELLPSAHAAASGRVGKIDVADDVHLLRSVWVAKQCRLVWLCCYHFSCSRYACHTAVCVWPPDSYGVGDVITRWCRASYDQQTAGAIVATQGATTSPLLRASYNA